MIAVSQRTASVITCDTTSLDVRVTGAGVSIVVPTTIDYAACIKLGITTLHVELIQKSAKRVIPTTSIKAFNDAVASKSDDRIKSANSEIVLLSRNIDITKRISSTFAGNLSVKSTSIEAIRSQFPVRSTISPQKGEKMTSVAIVAPSQDFAAVSVLRVDPGSIKVGSLPLDTAAALASTSIHDKGYAVSTLLSTAPGRETLSSVSSSSEKIGITVAGRVTRDQIASTYIRVTVRSKLGELQVVSVHANLGELYDRSMIPTHPPGVIGSFSATDRLMVTVTQRDQIADSLKILYRPVKDYQTAKTGLLSGVTLVPCPPGQTVTVPVMIAENSVVRVHAVASGMASVAYSGFVASRRRSGRAVASSLSMSTMIAYNTDAGVSLNLIVRDNNVDAVSVRRRNVRTGEISYITTRPVKPSDLRDFVDESVADLTHVEYLADLYMKNGSVYSNAASASVVRLRPRGIVTASVTASSNIVGNQTVEIKIVPSVKSNDVNFLINYVKSIGLEAAFQTDLETIKKSLLNCIKFDVIRYDLLSGEESFVGQTDSSIIDDIEDVNISSSFLYICEAFIRSPSQLTDVIEDRANNPVGINPDITRLGLHISKADVDPKPAVKRQISPARKNFSRSNFETGTMPAAPAKDGFRDGRTGDVFTARASVVPSFPIVSNVTSLHRSSGVSITWSVTGNVRLVDRFQVYAQSSGSTWTVSSASVPGNVQMYQVHDANTYTMPRYIKYYIVPVFLDGTKGNAVYSQEILLEKQQEI